MGTEQAGHLPVMVDRVLALFAPALDPPGAVLVDATLGRAGHARALLAAHPGLALVGLDTDTDAIDRLRPAAGPVPRPGNARACRLRPDRRRARGHGITQVQGVLFDLGVSSPQLDEPSRGFAYSYDAPLDMRMDQRQPLTAAEVLNTYPAARLRQGAARLRRGEVRAPDRGGDRAGPGPGPLTTTGQLTEIIRASIPAPARRTGGHPAKRTFQALRIEVNAELEVLSRALPAALDALAVGGRIVVLAYHSLEDRVVKRTLTARAVDTTPPGLPVPLASARPQFTPAHPGCRTAFGGGTGRQSAGRLCPAAGR